MPSEFQQKGDELIKVNKDTGEKSYVSTWQNKDQLAHSVDVLNRASKMNEEALAKRPKYDPNTHFMGMRLGDRSKAPTKPKRYF